ncbi:MAG: hypothetical protein ACM3SU_09570 [Acidobacteriota bacterium]
MIRKTAVSLAGLLASGALLARQDAARLLSEAAAAQASPAALARIQSLDAVADCTGPSAYNRAFWTEVVSLRPDKTLFRQTVGKETSELFVAGKAGWSRNPATGAIEPLPPGMMDVVRDHEFHFLFLEIDRRFHDPRLSGRDMVGGRACLVVAMADADGHPASACVDEATKLPLRVSFEPPAGSPKKGTIHIFPDRWVEIGGIRWVEAFTLKQNAETFTYRYTSIRPNSVDPKIFEIPASLRGN